MRSHLFSRCAGISLCDILFFGCIVFFLLA